MLIRPLLIAIGLLTRVPVALSAPPSEHELGHSVLAYPVVGLLLGGALAGVASVVTAGGVDLQAALLLTFWVGMTGAMHLDGVADSADAWVGGMGSPERTLAILKEPASGPMAIVTLFLLLLLKWTALKGLLLTGQGMLLLLPPVVGRMGILLLFLSTPYVRSQGMGEAAARTLPRTTGWVLLCLFAVGCFLLHGGLILAGSLSLFLLLRLQMVRRMGGATGDSAGAVCELLETVALVLLVL
ncbi:MAG: adenosylcobinamide-GDP ribazoletransferase [Magnetococcus sp. MYC-9]